MKLNPDLFLQREGTVWVSCEGEGEKDRENLKDTVLNYGVEDNFGFPKYYYPYMNKAGYQAPFVVLQLVNLPSKLNCRV
jgi:Sodium / potassium ATPase beta chain